VDVLDTVLDAVGDTPLVRLDKVARSVEPTVLAKLEMLNPGGSVKDRLVKYLVSHMERGGTLTRESVLVENSSGNTGAAMSMVAAVRGLHCVITIPDKMSREKIARMRAYGAEVVVAPAAVAAGDPRSYYSVARALAVMSDGRRPSMLPMPFIFSRHSSSRASTSRCRSFCGSG